MKVLVIDDAPEVAEVLSLILAVRWPGTAVVTASDGETGLQAFEREHPDLVILDIVLPGRNGYEICQEIRRSSTVPVLMLSVRDQDVDIVRGLEAGADDFVTKPFSHLELLARVHAVLRRVKPPAAAAGEEERFVSRDLRIDFTARELWVRGQPVRLTPTEFAILRTLVTHAGRVALQQKILEEVWGTATPEAARHLRVHVQHLRHKLGDNATRPKLIATEWRVGYRFMQPPQTSPAEESEARAQASSG